MKSFALILALLLTFQHLQAQDKVIPVSRSSYGLSIGYGLPLGSQNIESQISATTNQPVNSFNIKSIYGSYGTGIYLNGFFRRMFTSSIGLDLGVHYLHGYQYQGGSTATGNGSLSTETRNSSSKGFFITPTVIFQLSESKFRPYMKTGLVFGWTKNKLEDGYAYTVNDSTQRTDVQWEYKGHMSFGLKGALGVEFNTGIRSVLFAEISFISMNYFPEKSSITEYNVNGASQLNSLTTRQKETVFKKEYNAYDNNDQSKPYMRQPIAMPMSSLLISAGMRFILK